MVKKFNLRRQLLASAIAIASAPSYAFIQIEEEETNSAPVNQEMQAPVAQEMLPSVNQKMTAPVVQEPAAPVHEVDPKEAEILKRLQQFRESQSATESQTALERKQAQIEAEKKRAEERKRAEEEARKQAELKKQAAEKERKLVSLRNEISGKIPSLQDPENFKAMQKLYGQMWKIDSKSDHVRDARYSIAKFLTDNGNLQITRHMKMFSMARAGAEKDAVVAKIPEYADKAEVFLKESHWYLRESDFQAKLKSNIEAFRKKQEEYAQSKAEYEANTITLGDVGEGAVKAGKKTWEVTKTVGSGVADLGSKAFGRIKDGCWFNCKSEEAEPQEAAK